MAGEEIFPLADLLPPAHRPAPLPDGFRGLLPAWDQWVDAVEKALAGQAPCAPVPPAAIGAFLPPLTDPSAVYGAAANYSDHVAEMGAQAPDPADGPPFHFLLPPASLVGHGRPVPRPRGVRRLDWEVELAAVIGRETDGIAPERALEQVAGYTVANDLSCRDEEFRSPLFGMDWLRHKGWRGLTPLGPCVVPARFVPDPSALRLRLSVNGVTRQDSHTGLMIHSVAQQISALSALAPLRPGDLLLTGTPAGTATAHQGRYLKPGDRVVAAIDGVGRLENRIT
ncbi:fumarylacetoacetate hydrolase family protein [Streptomyces sp. DSM 44917]|uniref:Fumarylacetoacetate hydrolase family protein n=1 Tax=Streptomyces boetiae TaxID=3075541 RepID=A0ABU2L7K8_9ACTN|nr:fumarylacetoacetate hydrolase family protein [Streptomyces sp. DSM 44917]MDT0307549.1 fumarylacetoacetate hydrolase family protein [Streptomyces sp. DSM 44917]